MTRLGHHERLAWTRSSRRSARRRPSRRRSTGSGRRSSSGCSRPARSCPPERELCSRLGIARSTLRQALTALTESGHLYAVRGRGGGTFVSDPLPPADQPGDDVLARWREVCDLRLAIEFGAVALACQRADAETLAPLASLVERMDDLLDDYDAFRPLDVRFHIGLAEASGSARLDRGDDRGAGRDDRPHLPHPAPAGGAAPQQRAARADPRGGARPATPRGRSASSPTTCTAPSTCSPACCPAPDRAGRTDRTSKDVCAIRRLTSVRAPSYGRGGPEDGRQTFGRGVLWEVNVPNCRTS